MVHWLLVAPDSKAPMSGTPVRVLHQKSAAGAPLGLPASIAGLPPPSRKSSDSAATKRGSAFERFVPPAKSGSLVIE